MNGQSKVNDDINVQLLSTTSARGVLTFCEWSSGEFDVTNAVTALHRMARAPDRRFYSKDQRWPSVIGKAHQMIVQTCTDEDALPRLTKEYLVNAAWAFSVLGHRDEYLFECICEEVMKETKDLNPNEMTTLMRALANLGIKSERIIGRILAEARWRLGQFRPPALAGFAWSLAHLAMREEDMLERIARETIVKVRLFQPKQLSEMSWALAQLGFRKPALNGALTDATIGRIEEFNPRDLVNVVHSFAQLSAGSEAVMEVIADKLSTRMPDLDPQSLEKVARAFAANGFVDEAMMGSLATEVLNRLDEFTPAQLSVISWAFATLDVKEDMLIDAMKNFISLKLDAFQAADLAKMIPAFVKWGAREEVEGDLYMAAMNKMSKFEAEDLASVAEAYEAHGDQELLVQFLQGAASRFSAVAEHASAANWVKFTTLVAAHADQATRNSFEPKFVAAILRPLLQRLKDIGSSANGQVPHVEAMKGLQDFVSTKQLEHLGPYYTRHALLGSDMPMLSAGIVEHPDLQQVAQSDTHVAASWELQWRRSWWVEPSARLFPDGVPRSGSKFLPPLPGMKAGAGRNALLHIAGLVLKKCPEAKLPEVMGFVRIVATKFPGIDALAALCQFRRHLCRVRIEVDYIV